MVGNWIPHSLKSPQDLSEIHTILMTHQFIRFQTFGLKTFQTSTQEMVNISLPPHSRSHNENPQWPNMASHCDADLVVTIQSSSFFYITLIHLVLFQQNQLYNIILCNNDHQSILFGRLLFVLKYYQCLFHFCCYEVDLFLEDEENLLYQHQHQVALNDVIVTKNWHHFSSQEYWLCALQRLQQVILGYIYFNGFLWRGQALELCLLIVHLPSLCKKKSIRFLVIQL